MNKSIRGKSPINGGEIHRISRQSIILGFAIVFSILVNDACAQSAVFNVNDYGAKGDGTTENAVTQRLGCVVLREKRRKELFKACGK